MEAYCPRKPSYARRAQLAGSLFHFHIPSYEDTPYADILPLGQKQQLEEEAIKKYNFSLNQELARKWQEFKDGLPLSEKRIVKLPETSEFHFKNNVLQYLSHKEL